MSTKPIKYPYDPSGESVNNLVPDEIHVVEPGRRAFVPNYGAFFVESLVVHKIDGTLLEPHDDYMVIQPVQEVSVKTGKEVALAVYISNPDILGQVTLTYQAVGGEFSWSAQALQDMLDRITVPDFDVQWGDLIGKPTEWNPGPHMHDLGDTYGWEFLGWQAEKIARAILYGNQEMSNELLQRIRVLAERFNTTDNNFNAFVERRDNPNQVTAAQTGLGNVQNYPMASNQVAIQGLSDQHYMSPQATAQAIFEAVQRDFFDHLTEVNPHGIDKETINLGLIINRSQGDAEISELAATPSQTITDDRYASIANLSTAIRHYHQFTFQAHVAERNPHGTNKSDVGLPLVENFPMATDAEHQLGERSDRYVNPRGMSLYFQRLVDEIGEVGDVSAQHMGNMNNPHNVTAAKLNVYTKAQVDSMLANFEGGGGGTTNASDLKTGTVAISRGGTGSGTASGARNNLGIGSMGTINYFVVTGSGTPNVYDANPGDIIFQIRS